jgi:hypothetical protein
VLRDTRDRRQVRARAHGDNEVIVGDVAVLHVARVPNDDLAVLDVDCLDLGLVQVGGRDHPAYGRKDMRRLYAPGHDLSQHWLRQEEVVPADQR